MGRIPSEFALHLVFDGGHAQTVRVRTGKEVNDLIQQIFFGQTPDNRDVLHIPLQAEGEYLIVRPSRVDAVHVEPLFASSLERF